MKQINENKFIKILETEQSSLFLIENKKSQKAIGWVAHYPAWKKFVFIPEPDTVWDDKCLTLVMDLLEGLNNE